MHFAERGLMTEAIYPDGRHEVILKRFPTMISVQEIIS